ncbi:MAG: glycosyltransferase family 2 protein [Candidatus Cryptobacteroides sp.]
MRISIIIPVYNAQDYIESCLASIRAQDFLDYEVIAVDDGSTDTSGEICDRFASEDGRFKVLHRANGGVSSARNEGIDAAQGEYLMFVDSDDALLPGALKALSDAAGDYDFVLGGHIADDGKSASTVVPARSERYPGGDMASFFEDNLTRNCVMLDSPWAKLFRRSTVGRLRFNNDISYAEDKLFVFSFFALCGSAVTVQVPVYRYNIRPCSLGSDIRSDRHLIQMKLFLPSYCRAVRTLQRLYPDSRRIQALYHEDVVGRYVCRIINIFATRRTAILTEDYLGWVYSLMKADSFLGLFSIRAGQVFNILLYKTGSVRFSILVYKFLSRCSGLL